MPARQCFSQVKGDSHTSKVCEVVPARVQGSKANVEKLKDKCMHEISIRIPWKYSPTSYCIILYNDYGVGWGINLINPINQLYLLSVVFFNLVSNVYIYIYIIIYILIYIYIFI